MSSRLKSILAVATIQAALLLILIWSGIDLLQRPLALILVAAFLFVTGAIVVRQVGKLRADADQVAELARRETRLRNVVASSVQGILIHQEGRPVFANQAVADIFGYRSVDDVLAAESFLAFVAPAERERLRELSQRRITAQGELPSTYTFQGVRRDGRKIWLENRASLTDWDGAPAVLSIVVEVSDRLATEAALKDREAQYRETVDTALDCIIIIDQDSRIIEFNPAAEICFGFSRDQAIGHSLAELIIPPRHRSAHRAGMERYLESGAHNILNKRIELEAVRADGSEFPVELTVTESRGPRGPIFISYLRDIGEQKRNELALREAKEAAEVANRAKSDFLAMMSHEIRTPLNGVLGMLGILSNTALNEEQKGFVRTCRDSGDALLRILNDILDFSKMEAGQLLLEESDFDPVALANGVVELFAAETTDIGVRFDVETETALPGSVRGDAGRLRQILVNLAGNAVKFTTQGKIVMRIRAVGEDISAQRLRFEIEDTGAGVPEAERDKLFKRFTQVPRSDHYHPGGTGLGLAICKRLVTIMGGEIGYRAADTAGSIFWFELPFTPSDLSNDPSSDEGTIVGLERRLRPRPSTQNLRVLLAEDNPTNSLVAKIILEKAGYTVDIAGDGLEAVAAAGATPYNVILMDISMPHMNGLDATRAIRKLPPRVAELPIIAMTAHVIGDDRGAILAAGMDDYLLKPFSRAELLAMLDKWMGTRLAGDEAAMPPARNSGTDSHGGLIDSAAIRQLAEDTDPALVPKLMRTFLTDMSERIDRVEAAIEPSDLSVLRREAHALKSSAASFGAAAMRNIAIDLEACAVAEDTEAAVAQARRFLDVGRASVVAFETFLRDYRV